MCGPASAVVMPDIQKAIALLLLVLLFTVTAPAAQGNNSSTNNSGEPPAATAAAAAACPSHPVTISPAALTSNTSAGPNTTTCRVLIVGGGAAGIFSAYMMRELGSSVCVVERQQAWGGKLQNVGPAAAAGSNDIDNPSNAVIGTAGLWIHGSQTNIRCLAYLLNNTLETSHDDYLINARGQWSRAGAGNLVTTQHGTYERPAFNLTPADGDTDDLQDRLWSFLVGTAETNPLSGITPSPHPSKACANYTSMGQYINTTLGPEAYAYLIADMPEPANFQSPVDVCAWIESEVDERKGMGSTEFQLIPRGGWHGLLERARATAAAAGVRFFASSPIACISSVANALLPAAAADTVANGDAAPLPYKYVAQQTASGHVFLAERLIFASGPMDVRQLGGDVGMRLAQAPETASIRPIEVVVYDAFFPQRFWERYSAKKFYNMPVHTDANCLIHGEYPGHPYYRVTNATRPVYCADVRCIEFWKQLNAAGMPAIRSYVQSSLQSMFPFEQVPAPFFDAWSYHPDGWHLVDYGATQRNVSIHAILEWAAAPLDDEAGLCLAGEAYYGMNPGWTAGAWATAHRCIKQNFDDILSRGALAAANYISSGCSGRRHFPNEIIVKTNVSLPGLNPATGKPLQA